MEICGDHKLSFRDRILYLLQNARRNFSISRAQSEAFNPPKVYVETVLRRSPSRLLADLFLEHELSKLNQNSLNILEIGCGSGSMARKLSLLGYTGSYVGIDVSDNRFDRSIDCNLEVSLVRTDAHDYVPDKTLDLIISFSALEHIPREDALLRRLRKHMKDGGTEIHIVPGASALITYLWHGYRQYGILAIRERLGEGQVIRLGGFGSLLVHFCTITIPEIIFGFRFRRLAPLWYDRLVVAGLMIDRALPLLPTGLAFVRTNRQ
ncbi:MAG TPA: class I SAM-dependent methyltransferase [Xanthobacteraceae bacterium]|jgi:SAM-dependent methyltransferase|nr:class I SAM-dependent methyltransferase [Xanthobacteraceae bacterium]